MSDGIRQAIDETSRKFGIACPSFAISAIDPSQNQPARPRVLYYPQPVDPSPPNLTFPALPAPPIPASEPPPPIASNQRSLNLAAEPATAQTAAPLDDDFETVLPELPANSYPLNSTQTAMAINEDADESDDDRTSLDDSSDEDGPLPDSDAPLLSSQTVNMKQALPKSPTPAREVLYAPPPSPTPSQEGISQGMVQSPDMLPEFVSRVLNSKPPAEEATLLATDSSYEELLPPPALTAPAHPISPPMASPTEEDFTPSLAKYLDGLPPTPTVDLPPSETSDEEGEGDQQVVITREEESMRVEENTKEEGVKSGELDEGVDEDMEARLEEGPPLSEESHEMDETDDAIAGSMAADSLPLSAVSSEIGKEVSQEAQRGIALEHTPLEFSGEQMNVSVVDGLWSPPLEKTPGDNATSTLVSRTVTETASDPDEKTKVEDLVNSFDSSEVNNAEARSMVMKEQAIPEEEVENSAEAKDHGDTGASGIFVDEPVSSSVQRDQRRNRLQTPTSSIFEVDGSGSMERLPRRYSDGSIGERGMEQEFPPPAVRMPVTRSLESVVDENSASTRREMPLRTSRTATQRNYGHTGEKRMDLERKRNIAAMSEYQPAGKRQVPSFARTFDTPARQQGVEGVRGPFSAPQYPSDRHLQRSNVEDFAEMGYGPNSLNRKDFPSNPEWQQPQDDEATARKERARRARIRQELEVIERSQAEILGGDDVSSDEAIRRRGVAHEEDSDSEQDIFHDAYSEKPPGTPITEGQSRSKRHQKVRQRHRRSSRRDEGFYAEISSSDECEECTHHRHFDYYDHERVHRGRDRSHSRSESSRRREQDDDVDRYSENQPEARSTSSSRSRSRSDRKSSDSRRSDHSSRERSRKSKAPSSREHRSDRSEKSERSRSEKREREGSKSRSKSSDRKRSNEKSSKSSRKSSREVEAEKRKKDGKSKSRSKHRKQRSPPPSDYAYYQNEGGLKSIYRHRVPDSDSGLENPIPWYCEGQSAPEDTDVDTPRRLSSDSDARGRRSGRKNATTIYSSYGQRDKKGRRRRAHHNRRVTFLYDNVTLTR